MHRLLIILALILGGLLVAPASVTFAQIDDPCTDAVDNDGDGFVNDGCPVVGTSEAPAPTPTPEPTPVTTTPPVTQEPTATPTDLPDTGGDPDDPGDGDTTGGTLSELQFSEWIGQAGVAGAIGSFILTALAVFGVILSSKVKRMLAFGLGIGTALVYIAVQDHIAIDSVEDLVATVLFTLGGSQIAFLIFDGMFNGVGRKLTRTHTNV